MERHQEARRSYNVDKALNFLFDSDDVDQGNILDNSYTSSSESENEEDNLMVNIPPLDETLEEATPLPQDRQKQKRTKDPINSLKTAIDENNYENCVPSISKNNTENEIDKAPHKWEKPAVSRGCTNAANTSKRASHPEKSCRNNTSSTESSL